MKKSLFGAVAVAALVFAVAPASAAKMMGCSGPNLMKANGAVGTMADGPNKMMAFKEISMAEKAMLKGDSRGCAKSMNKAMGMTMMKSM